MRPLTLRRKDPPRSPLRGFQRVPLARVPRATTVLAVAVALPLSAQQAPGDAGITVQRVRANVHVASGHANGNVLVVASDTGLLLVDAQDTRHVRALDSALRVLSPAPVRTVINTHYHGDHTEGNAHFRTGNAEVLAHGAVRVQASKDTVIHEWNDWHRTPLDPRALPTRDVGDALALDLGGERAILLHAPRAHTDGDLLVWLPRANVLHMGDIFEMGAPPFIDWWGGGTLDGMVAATDRALALVDEATAIVPGHGPVSSVHDLRRYREMLVTVDRRVRAAVARGDGREAILAGRPAREWEQALGGERRAGHFVQLVRLGADRDQRRSR